MIYKTQTTYWLKTVLLITVSSLLFSGGIHFFLRSAKSFSSGLSTVPQLITYLVDDLKSYYALLYLAVNTPLIIYFYFKTKKKFVLLSTLFLILQTLWGLVWNKITDLEPSTLDPLNVGIYNYKDLAKVHAAGLPNTAIGMVKQQWATVIQGGIGGALVGFSTAIAWKAGGSTGGSDFIIYYISWKRKKSVGVVTGMVSVLFSATMIIIQASLGRVPTGGTRYQQFFGPITLATLAYIFFNSAVVSTMYPKYKKVRVVISTKYPKKVVKWLKEEKYTHGYQISESVSGYTNSKIWKVETVMLFLESKRFVRNIQAIDPKCFISVTLVKNVFGRFNHNNVE